MDSRSALGLCALLLFVGCDAGNPRVRESRRAEIAHVRAVLGLDYPYRIVRWDHYTDGGTLGALIVDGRGRPFEFSLDGRMRPGGEPPSSLRDTIRTPWRHFFVGAQYPLHPGAREIPVDGVEERAILDMLETIGLDRFTPDELNPIVSNRAALVARTHNAGGERTKDAEVLLAASLAHHRKHMDPRGMVISLPVAESIAVRYDSIISRRRSSARR